MRKGLTALAFGTFGYGVSEFVMMGILPYMANDFHIGISEAGHFISAYAIGVCVGAPLIAAFARKLPLKHIMYLLMAISALAALSMSLCPTPASSSERWQYYLMLFFRFLAGTPHGAFFGVGAIIAERLSRNGKAAFAVAIMCLGMAVANLIGNPLSTFITTQYSWRYIFYFSTIWNLFTLWCIARWVPYLAPLPDNGLKGEFRFMKTPAPWLLFICTAMGNGGIFCWYSYISPTLTQLASVEETAMTAVMVLAGAGMVIGNLAGGKLSDRFGPGRTGKGIEIVIFFTLIFVSLTTHLVYCALPLMVICTACLFAVSSPQQLLLIRFSRGGGELMGGALIQIAFNLGNAVGAWAGGLPINETKPQTYHYPATIGAGFALIGVISYTIFCNKYEKKRKSI